MKKSTTMLPMTSSQKKASPKPAKVGLQPARAFAPKAAPKTKKVAKVLLGKSQKKITGHNNKSKLTGSPISKKMTVKKVKAR